MDESTTDAFNLASRFLVQAVRLVPENAWDRPGLGSWNLLELVGHANRAHSTVEEYLLRPRPPERQGSDYFSDAAIAARGREAVAVLGDSPAVTIAAKSDEIIALVARTSPNATIGSPAGTMTLGEYLPSRIAELTIHGLDIVHALGAVLPVPLPSLKESLAMVAARAIARGNGALVLLALSGRAELPDGFSVY